MVTYVPVPPLPGAHARALALLLDSDAGLSEVAAIIEADPGLTAAMLRAANSAASAANTPIVRVADALVRIGFRNARSLVVAALLRSQAGSLDGAGIDLSAFWDHLLATGLIAVAAAPQHSFFRPCASSSLSCPYPPARSTENRRRRTYL